MANKEINRKLQVFISSRCGGKYTIARKALGFMLESTGLANVYVYENEFASSDDNRSAYLNEVDRSDLVIFLVDNADKASDPVVSEQQRAKANGLRLIYIFCDETERIPTQMQEEIKTSGSEKYYVAHEFSEMAQMAYLSVMQDLVTIYRNPRIKDESNTTVVEESIVGDKSFYILDRKSFPGGRTIAREISRSLLHIHEEDNQFSAFDEGALPLLWHVLGKQKFSKEKFDALKQEILLRHDGNVKEIISIRSDAMKYFYSGELDNCVKCLQEALQKGVETTDVPHWLLMDIAVDLRYALNIQLQKVNKYALENEGQKFITDSKEALYYPLLDRREKEMHELLSGYYFKISNNAPGSVHFGGVDSIIDPLGDICALAIMYASIIQLEMMRARLISILFSLCQLYQNHRWTVEMIILLILERKSKDLESYVRMQNCAECLLSQEDVERIWNAINTIPYSHWKMTSKYLVMQHFGYYASDDGFATMSGELINYSSEWIDDPERYHNLHKHIIGFYKENVLRIAPQHTIKFIENIFEKELFFLYGDALRLVSEVTRNTLSEALQNRLLAILEKVVSKDRESNTELRYNIQALYSAIVHFAIRASIDLSSLEQLLQQHDSSFFTSTYSMEKLAISPERMEPHIRNELDYIHRRNAEQGKNGVYHSYISSPFETIKNIVSKPEFILTDDMAKDIVSAAIETISAPLQTSRDKISSLKLLMWMYSKWTVPFTACATYDSLFEQINTYTLGKEGWFEPGSNEAVHFAYLLLLQKMNPTHTQDIVEHIFSVDTDDSDELIASLEIIENYLSCSMKQELGELAMAMLAISITASRHRERAVKFWAVKCLIALTHYEATQKYALKHLSLLLDQGTPEVKASIISRVKQLKCDDKAVIQYMLQKASVDTHYLVRKVAKKENDNE